MKRIIEALGITKLNYMGFSYGTLLGSVFFTKYPELTGNMFLTGMENASLDNYQWAYHVVREADLLSAYKFERALMYHMCVNKETLDNALDNAKDIFNNRVFLHNDDNLFFTEYAQKESLKLHDKAIVDMYQWNKIINLL